jgi:type I restriction enzyme S subunit
MTGWTTNPLYEVAQFINGLWKGEEPPFVHVGVIRNTNFTKEGALDDTDIAYLDVEAKKFQKRRLQFGDLILEKSGGGPKQPVGRVVLFDKTEGNFSFSNFTAAIRVIDPTALDSRFLHKYLHWVYVSGRTEAMQSHSTGIRNLNGDAYKAIEVAYPSLTEQRRIVAILDEAFEGIAVAEANTQKNLENARDLFDIVQRQRLNDVARCFETRELQSLCDVFVDSAHRTPKYQAEGIPALRPRDVVGGTLNLSTVKRVSGEEYNIQSKRYKPRSGDIVYSRELSYGWAAIIPDTTVCMSQGMCVFRPVDGISPRFLWRILNGPIGRDQAHQAAVGAAHPHINLGSIKAYRIPYMPDDQQSLLVDSIDKIEAEAELLASLAAQKTARLDELRKSLLSQAFSGAFTDKAVEQQVAEAA